MKIHYLPLLVLGGASLAAQSQLVEREVIATEGNSVSTPSGLTVSYTVGEPYVGAVGIGNITFSQGFQQGFEALATSWKPALIDIDFKAFPNPSQGILSVSLSAQVPVALHLVVYDLMGKEVHAPRISPRHSSHLLTLDLSHLPAGQYLLVCTNAQSELLKALTLQISP